MPNPGIPLDVYVVIDNCMLVGLCEYLDYANRNLAFPESVRTVCQSITEILGKLRGYALEGSILSTRLVQDEFKPEFSSIAERKDFGKSECEILKAHIKKEVEVRDIDPNMIEILRCMEKAPSKFGTKLHNLSNSDLSLVVLALDVIKKTGRKAYILTDDEDLSFFISWMRTRPEVKGIYPNAHLAEGIHSLIYLDGAHRQCAFTTIQIYQIFTHYQRQQMKRTLLGGTTKGSMIADTYERIAQAIQESGKIKEKNVAGAA